MRLSAATLARVPPDVARPDYDRERQATGIVHLGIGAFHRAHQAWYTDRAMSGGDRDWMIAGVSLRSGDVAAQLNPQDELYSLTERSDAGNTTRVLGAVREVVAPGQPGGAADLIAAATTHIVSLTITEKGYAATGAVWPVLAEGLARRRDAGRSGVTLLSCDNLAENGRQLARLLGDYCDRYDSALGHWIAAECAFPSTMVDRIVPATTEADRAKAAAALGGLRDEAAVVTEPFSQWVIEDRFAGPRPAWDKVGAAIAADVAPYELAKLRMLNGAHSALAYLGLARGYTYVHEAIADPDLRAVFEALMREAAASLSPASGQDLDVYTHALLERFANGALDHRLAQIAVDGSQKIPQRWLATLAHHQREDRRCPAILAALAAWLRHVRGDNGPVDDPLAQPLHDAWARAGAAGIVDAIFGDDGTMPSIWRPTSADRDVVTRLLHGDSDRALSSVMPHPG